jgi:hypothetical protein
MIKNVLLAMAIFVSSQVLSQTLKSKKPQKDTKQQTGYQSRQINETPTGVQTNTNLIWNEDFSVASSLTGDQGTKAETKGWNLTQLDNSGAQPNLWFISSTEAGVGQNSCRRSWLDNNGSINNTLHIGFQNAGVPINGLKEDFGGKFKLNTFSKSDWRIESSDITIANKNNITISFDYFYAGNLGESRFQVWYTDVDGQWQMLMEFTPSSPVNCDPSTTNPVPIWSRFENYAIPRVDDATTFKIAFRWQNDAGDENDKESWSCAVDNICVYGESPIQPPATSGDPTLRATSTNNNVVTQPPFWTEEFGQSEKDGSQGQLAPEYKGDKGIWEVTNLGVTGQKANNWYISATEIGMGQGNCSKLFISDNSQFNNTLHIGHKDDNGKEEMGAKYWKNESSATDTRVESPIIDCGGQSGITLSFDYFTGGVVNIDFLSLYYHDGTNWTLLTNFGKSYENPICNGSAFWSNFTAQLPASCDNNGEVKISFRWRNPASIAGNSNGISAAIDNINLTATPVVIDNTQLTAKKSPLSISSRINNNKTEVIFSSKVGNSFDVEKSVDGNQFAKIANIKPNKSGNYSFIDFSSKEGISYYRVVRNTGKKSLVSQTVISEVSPERKINFTIYPNPNSGQFTVDFGGVENNFLVDLVLTDENGVKIYDTQFELHSLLNNKLDVIPNNLLKNGRYYCILSIEGIKYTSIVVVK